MSPSGGSVPVSGRMDSETLQNKRLENYANPMDDICPQPSELLLLTMVTLHYRINSRTWGGSEVLHEENCITRTAELLEETERATTLLLRMKAGEECSDICMYGRCWRGLAANFGFESYTRPQNELHCTVPKFPAVSSRARVMYWNSLGFKCLQLFNSLSNYLRDFHGVGVDVSKEQFDFLLSMIPGEPISMQKIQKRTAISNSIILHQKPSP